MLGSGFKADRLRVNLRLAINRLKLLEKKKTEMAQKARKEIADYVSSGKDERARIRVEHIIREDYLVEAMEIIELYCDLLLARFGLIQSMKEMDPGLAEAISTLIWAAPRLAEVPELKTVASQFCHKYSKEYGVLCRTNEIGTVSKSLIQKLSSSAPPKILVEKYMIEIAKNYNVPYEPDSVVMAEAPSGFDHFSNGFQDNNKKGPPGGGGGAGGGDFKLTHYPKIQQTSPNPSVGIYETCTFLQPPPRVNVPPPLPDAPPSYHMDKPPGAVGDPRFLPDCGLNSKPGSSLDQKHIQGKYDHLPLPKLPSVPVSPARGSTPPEPSPYEDIDFEDLSNRLEELKKKT
ncbi:IST1 homolog [Spea bombifrons]|uniref:IST1 homolog n=1 Tax=Spea bombifrons TaxID=233779 RepID=UPI002349E56B|nr:IST1 homolog [Spea bombifrons]XP_053304992.1 IST1 homolog [Spea bombifrons]XP_053304993.1 IST1 homolog [Spea bombifrons]